MIQALLCIFLPTAQKLARVPDMADVVDKAVLLQEPRWHRQPGQIELSNPVVLSIC